MSIVMATSAGGVPAMRVPTRKSGALVLALRRRHLEPVEIVADLDLAGEARVLLHVLGEVEHGLLHRRRLADLGGERLVDIDMAGGARAGAAAIGVDARDVV